MNKDFNDIIESVLKCNHYIQDCSQYFNAEFISKFGELLDWHYNHLDKEVFVKRLQNSLQTLKDAGYIYDYTIDDDFANLDYYDIKIKYAMGIESIMGFKLTHHSENNQKSEWMFGANYVD